MLFYNDDVTKVISRNHADHMIENMDRDKDGKMSREELMGKKDDPHEAQIFALADEDKDGKLDRTELGYLLFFETHPEVFEATAKKGFKDKDKDGDGKVSYEEFERVHHKGRLDEAPDNYKALDKNSDGHLDHDE